MTEDELVDAFTDRDLDGCYPNGDPVVERTAEDGSLYDLLGGVRLVGDWWIENQDICYRYTGDYGHPAGIYCWNVVDEGGELYFFTADDGDYGGSSECADLTS